MAKIGFIGTGIMGKPMAQNLQQAGHELFVSTHHDPVPADLIATPLPSPKAVAEAVEFIIVMVPDTPHVEDVLFRQNGVIEGVGEGKVVIDMSSISPTATQVFAEKVKATGAQRAEIKRTTDIFRGQIVDVTASVYTVQLSGTSDKLDSFIQAIGTASILETVRSGVTGIARGDKVLSI